MTCPDEFVAASPIQKTEQTAFSYRKLRFATELKEKKRNEERAEPVQWQPSSCPDQWQLSRAVCLSSEANVFSGNKQTNVRITTTVLSTRVVIDIMG